MSFSKCLDIVNRLDQEDSDKLLDRVDQYIAMGIPAEKAQKIAAADVLSELKLEQAEFLRLVEEQHPEPIVETVPESTVTEDEVTHSIRDLGFYSELATQISNASMKQAPAEQWKSFIKALSSKGVKADEIEWSGVLDWLDLQKDKVTKNALIDYLNAEGVQVEETVLGAKPNVMEYDVYKRVGGRRILMETFRTEEEALDYVDEAEADSDDVYDIVEDANPEKYGTENDTKYDNYKLDGGENYREVLLTLPGRSTAELEAAESDARINYRWLIRNDAPEAEQDVAKEKLDEASANLKKAKPQYTSPHWDQPNVLAHLRVDDRVDTDGNKVLFVQEIQSDWGQDGKKKGFASPTLPAGYKAQQNKDGTWVMYNPLGGRLSGIFETEREAFSAALARRDLANEVPSAPFVTNTDKWLGLALKRVMVMAAQGGYDKVAFINGQQSADRYSLDQQLSKVTYRITGSDNYRVQAFDKRGAQISMPPTLDPDTLEEYLGKEIAQKIVDTASREEQSLQGEGLKIEAKGMREFYDKIVPNAVKGLLKKLGGGSLTTVSFEMDTNPELDQWEPEDGLGDGSKAPIQKFDQPGFDITPQMIKRVEAGVPLFSNRDNGARRRVYHGTPHRGITKFSTDKIGTGEGQQMFGWGLYFADRKEIAEHYRETLSAKFSDEYIDIDGRRVELSDGTDVESDAAVYVAGFGYDQAIIEAQNDLNDLLNIKRPPVRKIAYARKVIDAIKSMDGKVVKYVHAKTKGQLYEVEIPSDETMLMLDKKLRGQSKFVQSVAGDLFDSASRAYGNDVYDYLVAQFGSPEAASGYLYSIGLKGLKFLDGISRDNKKGSHNYVLFDGADAEIKEIFYSKREQTETPEFKRWFGDSKVVNSDGKPLVVYHGTMSGGFSVFDMKKSGGNFYFTSDPRHADAFAGGTVGYRNGSIIPAYLSIRNPMIVEDTGVLRGEEADAMIERILNGEDVEEPKNISVGEIIATAKSNGNDGVVIRNFADLGYGYGDTYIAFSPAQIKSAIGNNGNFDPEDPDIRHSARDIIGKTNRQYTPDQLRAFSNVGFEREVPSLKEKAQALWKDAGKKLAQGLFDQFAPIKDLDTTAYGLMRLAKGASGAFETLLKGGKLKLTDNVYDFDESDRGGVVDKLLIPMQGEHHDFLRWVAANRADRLIGEDKEHLFSQDDIDAIKTLQDGQLSFDYTLKNGPNQGQVTRSREAMYRDSLITFNEFNQNVMDMAEQSGLIDGDSRQYWEHEFYVPFYRMSEDDGFVGAKMKQGVVRQQAFKKLKGGKDKLNSDLLDNTLMNWAHLLDASAKNRAAKASLQAAESMGVALSTDEDTARQIGKATGNKNGVVWFMDDGVQHYYLVEDPFVLQAITSLEYAGMRNPVMNALSSMKHMLTVGVTASPFFKVRNLIRDSIQVIGTGPISYNVAKNLKDGWKLTDPKNDMYFRLLAGGGTIHFGTMEGSEAQRVQSLVEAGVDDSTILNDEHKIKAFYRKRIQPLVDAYNEIGNRGEAINRSALYDQLIKQGLSHAEASLQARDLMDFSMQGTFASVRFLTQVTPFLNARLQGLYKLGRASKEDPRRMAYVLGAAAVASLGLLSAYGDDDEWKKREDWDRNGFWWFKVGETAYRIPKPFELGAIATLAERMYEYAFDDEMTGARFAKQIRTLLNDNLSIDVVPQLAKPLIDIYANKSSFSGRPIETMSMEKLQPEYRFTSDTTMAARAISTTANTIANSVGSTAWSPVQIDHLINGYMGWLGMHIAIGADVLARPLTGQAERPDSDLVKVVTGGMVSQLEDAPSRYVSQVYEQAKQVEQAMGTWKMLIKEGKTEEAQTFKEDNIDLLKVSKNVEAVKGALSKINQRIKQVESSSMSGEEKRAEIRRLNARKDQFSRRLSKTSKAIEVDQ